jgi:hypothetical protein
MRTANLFPSWRIYSDATYVPFNSDLYAFCAGAVREGATEEPGRVLTIDTGVGAPYAVPDDYTTLLSARIKDDCKTTCLLKPGSAGVLNTGGAPLYWRVVRQRADKAPAAVLAGAWADLVTGSEGEYSIVNATYIPDATDVVYGSGYIPQSTQQSGAKLADGPLASSLPTGINNAGDQDILMLIVNRLNSAATTCYGTFTVETYS